MRRRLLAVLLVALAIVPLAAQRGGFRFNRDVRFGPGGSARYDGRFMLARLYYGMYPGWSYDWPDMEENLERILDFLTAIRGNTTPTSNILRMDDPDLLQYPVAYLSEPGFWYPTDAEAAGLREYIHKGGFLIVDDFHYPEEWQVFENAMMKVLPDARIERLDITHPIFNSFFPIKSLKVPYPGRLGEMGLMGEFFGIYDPDDPSGRRLRVVIDYNQDIGDYIEWSANGVYAVAPTNEAYKFLINYLVYGLTH